jgi:hypothetical protein
LENNIIPAFVRDVSREVVSNLIPKVKPVLILLLVFEQGCHWEDMERTTVAWQECFLG